MTTKPEALLIAELWDDYLPAYNYKQVASDTARELRRLHEAHDWQYTMAGERLRRIENLEDQNHALLEALKALLSLHEDPMPYDAATTRAAARAAIKKAEGV